MSRHSRRRDAQRASGHPSTRSTRGSPDTSSRHVRLEQLLLEAVASLLRDEAADERLNTVRPIALELSGDGSRALVAYVVRGALAEAEATARSTRDALDRARGWLRASLASQLELKRTPELTFRFVGVVEGEPTQDGAP